MALSSVYYFPFPEGAAKSGPRCIGPCLSRGFAKEESVTSGTPVPGGRSSFPNYFLSSASSASGSHTGAWQVKSLHT